MWSKNYSGIREEDSVGKMKKVGKEQAMWARTTDHNSHIQATYGYVPVTGMRPLLRCATNTCRILFFSQTDIALWCFRCPTRVRPLLEDLLAMLPNAGRRLIPWWCMRRLWKTLRKWFYYRVNVFDRCNVTDPVDEE